LNDAPKQRGAKSHKMAQASKIAVAVLKTNPLLPEPNNATYPCFVVSMDSIAFFVLVEK